MTTAEHHHDRRFDVAVIGAGPAGAATARRLALRGCSVALIERSSFDAPSVGESLVPDVQPLLNELGLWNEFRALLPLPSHGTRSLWGEATPQVHSHLASPWGCGWHIDRLAFDRMLAQAACAAGAALRIGTTLLGCAETEDGWGLTLQERDGGTRPERFSLQARVVIDATGRGARLAPWVGAQRLMFDHLIGLATQIDLIDTAHEAYVMVETAPDGWWYSAPVPGSRMMVMLMTDSDLCGRAHLASETEWRRRLHDAQATQARVAAGTPAWGPRVFSAISQRLRRSEYSKPWLAVGDAALAVDPISGSGVLRALRSARAAAHTTLALLDGRTTSAIEAYEAEHDRECTTYLHERAFYYRIERRWEDSAFWQRRAAAIAEVGTRSMH